MFKKVFQKVSSFFSLAALENIYLGAFLILVVVLAWYQLIQGGYYFQRAKNNYLKVIPLTSIRGSIFDRNAGALAYDRPAFAIAVIPYQIKDFKDSLFNQISAAAHLRLEEINENYRRNFSSFFSPVDIVTDIDKAEAFFLKEKFADKVVIAVRPQRYYPQAEEFAHLLGYVKPAKAFYEELKNYGYSQLERAGFGGVEQFYDTYLKGRDGGELIEVDSRGRIMGFLGEQRPHKGKDIYLTVDSRVQEAAYQILGEQEGVIILMDAESGEIITLCSKPSFNPNNFILGKNVKNFFTDSSSPLLNRAIQAQYPLGSTFKPIIGIAALEEVKAKSSTTFNCEGSLSLGSANFRCWSIHGQQNFFEAVSHSCNVYFYRLGLLLGPEEISRWAKKCGLDSVSGIDLASEAFGFVPDLRWKQKILQKTWFPGDTLNFAIGQGFMTTTPLAIMRAINIFANGGYLVNPHLIKKVGLVPSGTTTKNYLAISKNNLQIIRQALREAVVREDGTAHLLARLDLKISGKTGTAQNPGKAHGWFIGFFPYQNRTYTLAVLIEHGGSSYEAVKTTYYFLQKIIAEGIL